MTQKFQGRLRRFRRSQPGHRFQDYYHERQQHERNRRRTGRIVRIVLGILVMLVGIFFWPAPGPGTLIVVLGLALLASELLVFARFLDWGELSGRSLAGFAVNVWHRSPVALKVVYGLVLLAGATAAAYAAYRLVFG